MPRVSSVPDPVPLQRALVDGGPLAALNQRLEKSHRLHELIQSVLPESLRADVTPGPLDEKGWTILAANTAAAAKLRQMLPDLEQAIRTAEHINVSIRVHVRKATSQPVVTRRPPP